jgi:ubiquinone/menaquinone biosynthesis C-methylase UbiE
MTNTEPEPTSQPTAAGPSRDIRNPFFARLYHHVLGKEGRKMTDLRRELLEGLTGTVVEVGPGDGPNFPLYPATVERVVAVEPEPYLREKATQAARTATVPIAVLPGTAEELPLGDGEADAVLLTLVLCSVPDQSRALAEARRVLRPGGELRVFEHVGAHSPAAQATLKAAEKLFWRRAFGNCHPTRHTLAAVQEAGFDIAGIRRFVMQASPVEPPLPYIHGIAKVPDGL